MKREDVWYGGEINFYGDTTPSTMEYETPKPVQGVMERERLYVQTVEGAALNIWKSMHPTMDMDQTNHMWQRCSAQGVMEVGRCTV